jgi:shikimate kinase/3-dehydroquinate synthase
MYDGACSNLILTGFMGTGKTTVGREVARRLGRPFVDMDGEIVAHAGKSIPRIFAEEGEAAFRQMEAALCEELSKRQGLVIATGGGALIDPTNRERMTESGTVVCLTCDAEQILQRVNQTGNPDRPLLKVADPRAEIEHLLRVRRTAYGTIPWQIDTTGLPTEEVVTQVIKISRITTLSVRHPEGAYAIHIGNGVLAHVGGALRAAGVPEGSRVAVVSNPTVAPLYGAQVDDALRSAGLQPFACSMPDGEQHKTLVTLSALFDQLLAGWLDRDGTVLSLGGGVTGDVAGFAAASFMRGVRFAQAPTTLLAMVDASVGGKTGVDLPQGKNLIGAFKQPVLVAIDPTMLATLPAQEMRSGLVEAIKHGVIGAPDLFAELETAPGSLASWWEERGAARIARALRVKIAAIEEDPFEGGRRAVLNLGHTVGHALEKLSGFELRHGEAVGIGMLAAARIAAKRGLADPGLVTRIENLLSAWNLPTRCPPLDPDQVWRAMAHDKKRRGGRLRWVLPIAVGDVRIVDDVPPDVVNAVLLSMGARGEK